MHTASIYAMFDPISPSVYRYIGASFHPLYRRQQHLTPCGGGSLFSVWCRLLRDCTRRRPQFTILDSVSHSDKATAWRAALTLESEYVKRLVHSHPILNHEARRQLLREAGATDPRKLVYDYKHSFRFLRRIHGHPYPINDVRSVLIEHEWLYPGIFEVMSRDKLYPLVTTRRGNNVLFSPQKHCKRSRIAISQSTSEVSDP